jgi:ABC-2 type transport system permease protein
VIGAIALVVGEVVMFVAFFLGQAVISGNAPTADLGQPRVLRAVVGCGLYVTVFGPIGVGLGVVLRSTAAAISSLVAILYVLPGLAVALPARRLTSAGRSVRRPGQSALRVDRWDAHG